MRADARRNYERLVMAARRVFTDEGTGASMEAVARDAGVGIGTLYRHFPKRIDLVEAVYRNDVEELVTAAEKAVANSGPLEAVDEFLQAFVRYAEAKRTLLSELREAFDKDPELKSRSRARIDQALDLVLSRAQRAGVVRGDVDSSEVVSMIAPVCTSSVLTAEQSARLVGLVFDGLRTPAPPR